LQFVPRDSPCQQHGEGKTWLKLSLLMSGVRNGRELCRLLLNCAANSLDIYEDKLCGCRLITPLWLLCWNLERPAFLTPCRKQPNPMLNCMRHDQSALGAINCGSQSHSTLRMEAASDTLILQIAVWDGSKQGHRSEDQIVFK
jgi:hypothetical protein